MPREETKRYVQNYTGVVDLRPATGEDLVKREDELYSDEELDPGKRGRRASGGRPWKERTGG
eukprot:2627926-Pyramimonas_sp.AAC.1